MCVRSVQSEMMQVSRAEELHTSLPKLSPQSLPPSTAHAQRGLYRLHHWGISEIP